MRRTTVAATLTIAIVIASSTCADQVRLATGGTKSGVVLRSSREGVEVETIDGVEKVPVDEIRYVIFDDEPPLLTQTYSFIERGGYETALEKLNDISETAGVSDLVRQDIDFYRALCAARIAIGGAGESQEAGRQLSAFVKENGDSFHYYDAVEALGDLLVSLGRYDQAERTYSQIGKSTSVPLKARAAFLSGRALQAAGKHDEALRRFDALIGARTVAPGVVAAQQSAKLAKAESLAATGNLEGGLELARNVIKNSDPREAATLAAAYNALGSCYESAGKPKDALFAYLHTDLLFGSDPATHAEALARLGELWRVAGKPDASRDALARLRRQYAASLQARSVERN